MMKKELEMLNEKFGRNRNPKQYFYLYLLYYKILILSIEFVINYNFEHSTIMGDYFLLLND